MKYLIYLLGFTFLFMSCKEKSQLEKDVMAVHDEVMPKLGELNKIRRNLKKVLPNITNEKDQLIIKDAMLALEKADDGMMDWMQEYKIPKDPEAKVKYLNSEMIRITKVKEDMLTSMKNGKSLLEKYKS